MEVYLTVDTECTEERLIRGTIRPPLGYDLMMRGRFDGYASGFGTDLIVRALGQYGFQATFFVETLCTEFFGVEGLAAVCRDLLTSGQDIQLHLHPNFRKPEWRHQGQQPVSDNIGDYSLQEQETFLRTGIEVLVSAGVPRSSIAAFRAGNYGANNVTWQALRNVGLSVDSSFNLWAVGKDCQIVAHGTPNDLYEPIPGVWELPITCFSEARGYRHLEIAAVSAAEMRHALRQLRQAGARAATIVTHPGEFFVVDDRERRRGRPNTINIARLRSLLAFLDGSRNHFEVRTVGWLGNIVQKGRIAGRREPMVIPRGSSMRRTARLPMQAIKRYIMRPRLS